MDKKISDYNSTEWQNRFKFIRKETMKEATALRKNFFKKGIRVLGVSGSARDEFDMAQGKSNSEWLLEKCLYEAKLQGAETKILPLRKYDVRYCKACYSTTNTQCHYKCSCYPAGKSGDDMTNKFYDLIGWADVIVFATPVNNFKISSLMSLFIDRMISLDGSLMPADVKDSKNKNLNLVHAQFVESNATEQAGTGYLRRMAGKTAGIIVTGHEAGASLAISSLFMTLNHYGFIFPPFSTMYAIAGVTEATATDKNKLQNAFYEGEARLLARNLVTAVNILKQKNNYQWSYQGDLN